MYIYIYLTLYTRLVPIFRVPSVAIAELEGHQAALNGIVWAPHSASHVCTSGDDKQILIWDLAGRPKTVTDPILAFSADGEINGVQVSIIYIIYMYTVYMLYIYTGVYILLLRVMLMAIAIYFVCVYNIMLFIYGMINIMLY